MKTDKRIKFLVACTHTPASSDEKPLRELQDDLWASVSDFPKEDWRSEVANDETHQGYWEWVAHNRCIAEEESKN